jgi:hypothetical protein
MANCLPEATGVLLSKSGYFANGIDLIHLVIDEPEYPAALADKGHCGGVFGKGPIGPALSQTFRVRGYAEKTSVLGEHGRFIFLRNSARFQFIRQSPHFMPRFTVDAVRAREDIAFV